jgi:hypothetical protein
MEKHTPFFEVLEALRDSKACGICDLAERSSKRHLDSLLYESVNDQSIRDSLRRATGFCRRHSEMLLSFGDSLGTAILYRDHAKDILEKLKRQGPGKPKALMKILAALSFGATGERVAPEICPECKVEEDSARLHLSVLLSWLGDEDMRKSIENGNGLCAKHLFMALSLTENPAGKEKLVQLHSAKFETLLFELSELIRKNDYLAIGEKIGNEADSWIRAVKLIQT